MNEMGIVLAVVGFIFGSLQYFCRIKLQDAKENILRVVGKHFGDAQQGFMSLYTAIDKMKECIGSNVEPKVKKEFRRCLLEYTNATNELRFWGVMFPFVLLILYFIYKFLLVYLSTVH